MFVATSLQAKPREREEARRLRSTFGMPVKRIARRLGVSPSSVSLWVRDIPVSNEQRQVNLGLRPGPTRDAIEKRVATWIETNRARRRGYQEEGRERARQGDPLHTAGCMLYWAEGAKQRNSAVLANSDPNLLVLYCRFLRESLGVRRQEIAMSLNVYTNNGLTIEDIERFWLDWLDLPTTAVRQHVVNHHPTSSSGKRRNLPYGVCRISVASTRIVQHIYGAIQEYGGFDEPMWLDGRGGTRTKARSDTPHDPHHDDEQHEDREDQQLGDVEDHCET